eukprot:3997471-Amphidinium_carterae.1
MAYREREKLSEAFVRRCGSSARHKHLLQRPFLELQRVMTARRDDRRGGRENMSSAPGERAAGDCQKHGRKRHAS